jgi:hypothetical protein
MTLLRTALTGSITYDNIAEVHILCLHVLIHLLVLCTYRIGMTVANLAPFTAVPLVLRISALPALYALDEHTEPELYTAAFNMLHFAVTGEIDTGAAPPAVAVATAAAAAMTGVSSSSSTSKRKQQQQQHSVEDEDSSDSPTEQQDSDAAAVAEGDVAALLAAGEQEAAALPEAPDPVQLKGLQLRRYQRQALAWMLNREADDITSDSTSAAAAVGAAGGDSSGSDTAAAAAASAGSDDVMIVDPTSAATVDSSSGGSSSSSSLAAVPVCRLKGGCVQVDSWTEPDAAAAAGGIHPLWEQHFMATSSSSSSSSGGGSAAAAVLSEPVAFYLNRFARRFQLAFPPAARSCKGGILADEVCVVYVCE